MSPAIIFHAFQNLCPGGACASALVVLAACLALWVLYRWGAVILMLYAIVHLCLGQWTAAGLAFFFACVLTYVRAAFAFLERITRNHSRASRT